MLEIAENDALIEPEPSKQHNKMSIGERIMRTRRNSVCYSDDESGNCHKEKAKERRESIFKKLSKKAVEKLYINRGSGRVKITNLETIFEHESEGQASEDVVANDPIIFGGRKLKRSATLPDGKPTKQLKERRIKRVRSVFGNKKRFKKISMKCFLERLDSSGLLKINPTQKILDE